MKIKQIASFVWRHKTSFMLAILIIIGFAFRFYDFGNRFGYAYDQSRDVLVARYAILNHKLPLTGPFSSAGPFVYGPQWHWFIIVSELITPGIFLGPWIIQSLLYVFLIFLMFLIGREIKDKNLGLILAALTAFSTGQIAQAINLIQPSLDGILAVLCVYFYLRSIKYLKVMDSFLLGFFVGNAVCVHFQAIGLLIFIPISMFFNKRKVNNILVLLGGLFIPFIPLIFFDFTNNHFESLHLLQYYLHDQYKTSFEVLGRRWSTYLFSLWPSMWARVTGGTPILVYLLLALGGFFMTISKKRRIDKLYLTILVCFAVVVVQLRYFRGPLFDSYITFLHPLIIILTGGIIYFIIRKNKYAGFLILALFLIGSTYLTFQDISHSNNSAVRELDKVVLQLQTKYPGQKISLYDYQYKNSYLSMPLTMKLYYNNMSSKNGIRLGLTSVPNHDQKVVVRGIEFSKLTSQDAANSNWVSLDPTNVYHSIVEWYRK